MATLVRKRRKRRVGPKSLDLTHMGEEPTVALTNSELIDAYNWYNYFYGDKAQTRVGLLKKSCPKTDHRYIDAVVDWKVSPSLCYMARMLDNKAKVSKESIALFKARYAELIRQGKDLVKQKAPKATVVARPIKKNPYQRLVELTSEHIAYLESEVIDPKIEGKRVTFNCYQWLTEKGINAKAARIIANYYRPQLTDEDVKGSYKKLIESIVADCDSLTSNKVKQRKPRAKRVKSVDKTVSKVKFLAEYPALKIASVNPSSIVGAEQAWIYDVKKRELAVYIADDPKGLTISRSSIRGFSTTASIKKKVRKPDVLIANFANLGKVDLRKVMPKIKSKAGKVSGRLNERTIILRTVK